MRQLLFLSLLTTWLQAQDPVRLARAVDAEAPAAASMLERLVNQNSGTFNLSGVSAIGEVMLSELKALGFDAHFIPMDSIGRAPHILAERKGKPGSGKPILLIGHMDTVFEPTSPFQRFERKEDGRSAVGPGSADMKGGLVVMLLALKAMQKSGQLDGIPITVFLTADEEAPGEVAVTRRDMIEAGKKARAALCFETGVRVGSQDFSRPPRAGASLAGRSNPRARRAIPARCSLTNSDTGRFLR